MRKLLLFTLLALVGLVVAGVFIFKRYTAAFPELAPGIYAGTLQSNQKGVDPIPWLVAKYPGEHSLAVGIGNVRVPAQRVAPVDPSGRTRLPLVVGEGSARLKLTGAMAVPGRYEGEYLDPISQEEGRWTLRQCAPTEQSAVQEQGLIRWFSLWQEIERIEQEIQASYGKADQQRMTIENLHRYVSDDDLLRKTANVRLGRTDSALDAAREELQLRQQQLDKAIRDFDLSQRISQEGKLVFLSRETIQRESRWIELRLQLLAPETSMGFDQALARAERVRALQAQIRRARDALVASSAKERYPGSGDETRREEEFYGQLQ